MENYYFTYWIKRYGREKFQDLTTKVFKNMILPKGIGTTVSKDEYLFHYFFMTYYIVSLHYFGLDTRQISLLLDLAIEAGASKAFPPNEILEIHKEVIPEIEDFIKQDLNLYK